MQNTVKIGRNLQAMNALAHKHSAGAMLGCYFQYALAGRQTLTTAKQLQAGREKILLKCVKKKGQKEETMLCKV